MIVLPGVHISDLLDKYLVHHTYNARGMRFSQKTAHYWASIGAYSSSSSRSTLFDTLAIIGKDQSIREQKKPNFILRKVT